MGTNHEVAIKIEEKAVVQKDVPQLRTDFEIYKKLDSYGNKINCF